MPGEERKGLEPDKKPIDYAKLTKALLIVLSVSLLALWFAPSNSDEYYYRAYLLDDQYIGDIEDNGQTYENVLTMDVIPVMDKTTGELNLRYEPEKYGFNLYYNLDDSMSNFVATKPPHRLYFANEDSIRTDLENGTVIVARWKKNLIRRDVIRGVKTFTTDTYFPEGDQ